MKITHQPKNHVLVSICTYTKPCIQQALNTSLSPRTPHPPPPHPHPHPTHPHPPFWQTKFSSCIFLNENDRIPIQISFNYAPWSPIDNKPAFGSGNGLAPNRRQAITWTNDDPVQWRIYAALEGDGLTWYKLKGAMKHIKHHKIFTPYYCKITQKR